MVDGVASGGLPQTARKMPFANWIKMLDSRAYKTGNRSVTSQKVRARELDIFY
jgi:hypothetical protein